MKQHVSINTNVIMPDKISYCFKATRRYELNICYVTVVHATLKQLFGWDFFCIKNDSILDGKNIQKYNLMFLFRRHGLYCACFRNTKQEKSLFWTCGAVFLCSSEIAKYCDKSRESKKDLSHGSRTCPLQQVLQRTEKKGLKGKVRSGVTLSLEEEEEATATCS